MNFVNRGKILRIYGQRLKPGSFGYAQHKIHILDGLPGRPFNQVINATDNDELARSVVNSGVKETEIVGQGMFGVGREFYELYKGFIPVEIQVKLS